MLATGRARTSYVTLDTEPPSQETSGLVVVLFDLRACFLLGLPQRLQSSSIIFSSISTWGPSLEPSHSLSTPESARGPFWFLSRFPHTGAGNGREKKVKGGWVFIKHQMFSSVGCVTLSGAGFTSLCLPCLLHSVCLESKTAEPKHRVVDRKGSGPYWLTQEWREKVGLRSMATGAGMYMAQTESDLEKLVYSAEISDLDSLLS